MIAKIANEIMLDWPKINFAAVPYLRAMRELHSIDDRFCHDDARSIIRYFLSNASTYRGPRARELKTKLREML